MGEDILLLILLELWSSKRSAVECKDDVNQKVLEACCVFDELEIPGWLLMELLKE